MTVNEQSTAKKFDKRCVCIVDRNVVIVQENCPDELHAAIALAALTDGQRG